MNKEQTTYTISLGTTIAVVISYVKWHSILWAFLHGLCGWLYVIYAYVKGY